MAEELLTKGEWSSGLAPSVRDEEWRVNIHLHSTVHISDEVCVEGATASYGNFPLEFHLPYLPALRLSRGPAFSPLERIILKIICI